MSLMSMGDQCPDPADPPIRVFDSTLHVPTGKIEWAPAGAVIYIQTSNLLPLPAPYNTGAPDTVLTLMRCDSATCASGTVVEIDDDDADNDDGQPTEPLASSITYVVPVGGVYQWMVRPYPGTFGAREGVCDIAVQLDNAPLDPVLAQVFGGRQFTAALKPGDAILVGKNNNTNNDGTEPPGALPIGMPNARDHHDTTLFLFETVAVDCSSQCGRYQFSDDVFLGGQNVHLSSIVAETGPANWSWARGVVGSYYNFGPGGVPYTINTRVLLNRYAQDNGGSWDCFAQIDNDGDGLTPDVEAAVGSCDSAGTLVSGVGVVGFSCAAYGNLVNAAVNAFAGNTACPTSPSGVDGPSQCWHSWDSDNDGVRDDWEVWAAIRDCEHTPVGPLRDVGVCVNRAPAAAVPVFGCGNGQPFCLGQATSALSNPHPAVFDIFTQVDYSNCSGTYCTGDFGPGGAWPEFPQSVPLMGSQLAKLPATFTDDPVTCWDGSTTYPCTGIDQFKDLPYRVRMHMYNGPPFNPAAGKVDFPDSNAYEFAMGLEGTFGIVSFFQGRAPLAQILLGYFHYAFSTPYTNGQTGVRFTVWGNTVLKDGTGDPIIRTLAHELGHQLMIEHPHETQGNVAQSAVGQCSTSLCTVAGCNCIPAPCAALCSTAPGTCTAACTTCITTQININGTFQQFGPNNPAAASIMSYNWENIGMLPKNGIPPSGNTCLAAGGESCNQDNLRFSKGLNPQLNEQALSEKLALGPQAIKLARDLRCFRQYTLSNPACSPYTAPGQQGPWCDATWCNFNYNGDTTLAAPETTIAFDISRGPFNNPATQLCGADVLTDRDEWRRIVATSKQNQGVDKLSDSYTVFAFSFNGEPTPAQPTEQSGWAPTVTSTATLDAAATYERNMCLENAHCCPANNPSCGRTCRFDTCTANNQCRSGACNEGGSCTCAGDIDCHSSHCVNGVCVADRGACSCTGDAQCVCWSVGEAEGEEVGINCCPQSTLTCATHRSAAARTPAFAGWRPRESAIFAGNQEIRMAQSALLEYSPVYDSDDFDIRADFRFDGFQSGETEQVLVDSTAFRLDLVQVLNVAMLRATLKGAPGNLTVYHPAGIEPRHWYRFTWAATVQSGTGTHRLWVWPWNMSTADWDMSLSGFTGNQGACAFKTGTFDLLPFSEIVLGRASVAPHQGFRGRIDNPHMYSFAPLTIPGCVQY